MSRASSRRTTKTPKATATQAKVAPAPARRRYQYRGRGQYEGARGDLNELRGWTPSIGSADSDTLGDLKALRARTRDAERNQPLAAGALLTKLDNVVGWGLYPSAQVDHEVLGITEDEGTALEKAMEGIYELVTGKRSFDAAGNNNMAQLQRLVFRTKMSGGDCFAVRRWKPRPGDLLALKIQILEADRCANPPGEVNHERLRDGIVLDELGCAIGYWFASHHPGDSPYGNDVADYRFMPAYGAKTGTPMVLHIMEQLRPGQSRGVPELATVLRQLKQLDRYTDSELEAAVVSSFFTVLIERAAGAVDDGMGLDDLVESGTEGLVAGPSDVRMGPGAVAYTDPGEKVSTANPGRPNAQFDPFVSAVTKYMGVALGLPHELLLKAFNSSYSASRAALLEAWRSFETLQDWLVSTFCQPVYEWVIAEAVARGLINAPGFDTNPLLRAAYLGTTWNGPTPTQLDPLKEVNAAAIRVEKGFSTLAIETAQLTGQNWRRVVEKRGKERSLRVAAGLEPASLVLAGVGGTGVVAPGRETTDDDELNDGDTP